MDGAAAQRAQWSVTASETSEGRIIDTCEGKRCGGYSSCLLANENRGLGLVMFLDP